MTDSGDAPGPLAREFARQSVRCLRDTYLARLERALEVLPPGDLWWQPHEGALSFGQVLRHLEGNVRQWLLSGLGGAPDRRERAGEFAAPDGRDGRALLDALGATVRAACGVIEGLDEGDLLASHAIQGFSPTGLEAVLHVVEHFSWHTGQAVWIAKARAGAGHGLAFYDQAAIDAARNA